MPELLTQPITPECPGQVAGIKSEWWPASNRNGGRHQIGIPGRLPSESTLSGKSIENDYGHINRWALGYMFGFVDGVLKTVGQDATNKAVGMPFVHEVIRHRGSEGRCVKSLVDQISADKVLTAAAVAGNADYLGYVNARNRDDDPKAPVGFCIALIEGAAAE